MRTTRPSTQSASSRQSLSSECKQGQRARLTWGGRKGSGGNELREGHRRCVARGRKPGARGRRKPCSSRCGSGCACGGGVQGTIAPAARRRGCRRWRGDFWRWWGRGVCGQIRLLRGRIRCGRVGRDSVRWRWGSESVKAAAAKDAWSGQPKTPLCP